MTTLYVGGADHILVLSLTDETFLVQQRIDVGLMPSFLCFSSRHERLYAAVEGGDAVATLRVGADGRLEDLGRVACEGGPAYVSVDRSRRWLFSASYGSGELRIHPIADDGLLRPAAVTQTVGRWAHAALTDPSNRELHVPCKGSDWIARFEFDADSGEIQALPTIPMPVGSGPRHLVFSRDGRLAYVMNENDCSLSVLERTPTGWTVSGHFPTLPRPWTPGDSGADIHLSPDERFLYVSNRGHDSLTTFACRGNSVAWLANDSSAGAVPRNFCLLGEDRLVVAHQDGQSLGWFERDPATGRVRWLRNVALGERAYWVGTVEHGAAW